MIDLTGKIALVTGGSRGIGRACALKLAAAGADVVINYVTSHGAALEVAKEIQALGRRVAIVKADVSEADDAAQMMEFVDRTFGQLDILVSNAALIQLVQSGVKLLQRSQGRAKVIALSSHGSHMALPMYGVVGGSKAALESFMRHFALELGDKNINFNIVKAGLVETDSTRRIPFLDEMVEATKKYRNMTGERMLEAEDVANAVLFLASPLSDMVQGETLTVDCGAGVRA
jgi:enoyl-[acyl-carrier protein] reductase III